MILKTDTFGAGYKHLFQDFVALLLNIHSPSTEGIRISWGCGRGFCKARTLKYMKLNWNFQWIGKGGGGGGCKKKSTPWWRDIFCCHFLCCHYMLTLLRYFPQSFVLGSLGWSHSELSLATWLLQTSIYPFLKIKSITVLLSFPCRGSHHE